MASDEGDLNRWRELSGLEAQSSRDELINQESSCSENIERVRVEGDTYFHQLSDGQTISVQHEADKGLSFQIWPSSLTLVHYAEELNRRQPGRWKLPAVKGQRILELGCGCGLAGLVFAALGATVCLTDLPATKATIDRNISLNSSLLASSGGTAVCFPLCWGESHLEEAPDGWQQPDLVVAADVIYHKHLFLPLYQTMKALAGPTTAIVLAHVRRWKDDKAFFTMARKSFVVQDIDVSSEEGDEVKDATLSIHRGSAQKKGALRLYRLTRKPL